MSHLTYCLQIVATVSNDFVWRLSGVHHPAFWVPHCSLALPRVTLQTLGLWARSRFSEQSGKKGSWLVPYGPRIDEKCSRIHIYKRVIVPWVMRNGPNMYLNVDTNPLIYRPGRSITVDIDVKDPPTGDYGRYRRSIRIYLKRITDDCGWWIKIRDNFVVDCSDDTCAINRSNQFCDFWRLDRLDRFGKIIKSIFPKFWKREFQFFSEIQNFFGFLKFRENYFLV